MPNLILVAQVAGAFGVRGEVRLTAFTEDPLGLMGYGALLNAAGAPIADHADRPRGQGRGDRRGGRDRHARTGGGHAGRESSTSSAPPCRRRRTKTSSISPI